MSSPLPAPPATPEELDDGATALLPVVASVQGQADDSETDETVSIELDFNAFADHVPETHHARRVARVSDPSVQDFADQALEIAALSAELKRMTRDYEALQHTLRVRDARLHALQQELVTLRARVPDAKPVAAEMSDAQVLHELSVTMDLVSQDAESTATIVVEPTPAPAEAEPGKPVRKLIPVDHEGEPIALTRDIMTVGRTRANDICIPSRGVSRDHARLVVSARSVTVIDMQSANGCFVNDEPIKRHKLRDSDVLRIGDRSYRFATIN